MAKQLKIILEPTADGDKFVVVKMVNTLRCQIGEYVNHRDVQHMMRQPNLTIEIREPGIRQQKGW